MFLLFKLLALFQNNFKLNIKTKLISKFLGSHRFQWKVSFNLQKIITITKL